MLLILFLILILVNIYFKHKKSKIDLYPIIIMGLILYSGLKFNYGYDYKNYLIHFEEIYTLNDLLNTSFEKGYSFLVYFFKLFGLGFNTFLLCIAYTSINMKKKVFDKFSVFPEVSLLLYFLLFYLVNDVEQIRHGISIGFCFYSMIYLFQEDIKSKIYSFLLIICGILFHTSAVLFIPIYFIKDKLFNRRVYYILIIVSLLLSFVDFFNVLTFINNSFLHSNYITQKVNMYIIDKHSFFNFTLLIKIFILLVFYLWVFDYKNKLHRLLFNIYFIGILYTILLSNMPIVLARGTIYMRYCELLMIPMYFEVAVKQKNKIIHFIIVTMILGYYFLKFILILKNPEYFYYTSI